MSFSFGSTPVYVDEGQTIRLRFKAPSAWNTTQTVTVQIGDQTTLWYIVTIPEDFAPDPFAFTDLEDVDKNTLFTWADGTRAGEPSIVISGLTTNTEASVNVYSSFYSSSVDDFAVRVQRVSQGETVYGAWTIPTLSSAIVVSNTDKLQVRLRSSQSEGSQTYLSLAVGARTERWNITTFVRPPNVPEPFPNFTDIINQPFDTRVYSEILRVTGLNAPALVVTSNNALAGISDGNDFITDDNNFDVLAENGSAVTFSNATATTVTITNGQYLQLAYDTGTAANTSVENLLSIGEGLNLSSWNVTTGNFPSTTPDAFSFPDVTNQPVDTEIESVIAPVNGITGLGAGTTVQATLVSTNPGSNYLTSRVRVHRADGSVTSKATFPVDVQNGDKLQLYTQSSPNNNATTGMIIKVGTRTISSWDITTELGADTDANYTTPSNLTGQPTGKSVASATVLVTGINRPIQIDASGAGKISIDFAAPVEGPVTFDPDVNTGFRVFLVTGTTLNNVVTTNVTVGTGSGNTFAWSATTWASEPTAPELRGTWYAKKNARVYYDASNSANVVVESKDDGMAIGTVLTILKQSLGPGRNTSPAAWVSDTYGDLSGDRDSRYPGYLACDGSQYNVADYLDLFLVIGNQYGGTGNWDETTNTATGNFKVPDYRNRKLTGTGRVDGNAGSSAFLPSPSTFEPGNVGGWWYIDNVDVTTGDPTGTGQQSTPFQQWIGSGDSSDDSIFFDIGTVKTVFNETILEDVDFTVTGNVNAIIGPLLDARVNTPAHSHFVVSAQTGPSQDPLVPWNARIMGWGIGIDDDEMLGLGQGAWIDADLGDEYWQDRGDPEDFAARWKGQIDQYAGSEFSATMSRFFQGNTGQTFEEYLEEIAPSLPPAANNTFSGSAAWAKDWSMSVWWPHWVENGVKDRLQLIGSSEWTGSTYPFNDLANEAPSAVANRQPGQSVLGGVLAGSVIDVDEAQVRVDSYVPQIMLEDLDASTETHSHFLTTQAVTDINTDFSYGNVSGVGSARRGLGNAGTAINIGFTQSEVDVALNSGTFTFNESFKKPIPNVVFRPNKKVPLVENFHKVKYIIKAY